MYTIVGGRPFPTQAGPITFLGLSVIGTTESFEEMQKMFSENIQQCCGLIIVLHNGKELKLDINGEFIRPE